MQKTKIAMVGYHNTLPFLYGLEKMRDRYGVLLDVPSKCMEYFERSEVDVALVPVGSLVGKEGYQIISDFCIGCNGEVETVCVYADAPVQTLRKIYLDAHSRTSQLLTKILARDLWQIDPVFEEVEISDLDISSLEDGEGVLMIGDKAFGAEGAFAHVYDLGSEWKSLTGLPFAFAVWIARPDFGAASISELNDTLAIGVDNMSLVLEQNQHLADEIDLATYFERYIDFDFDKAKREALYMFMSLVPKTLTVT